MWIFEYRDLIQVLTISNLKIKYQSSVLGFAWSLINPLFMMIILYIVFSGIFKISEKQFALYILIGIVTWRFFTSATNLGMISIVSQPGLVKKIFFPREILVFSSVLSCLISSLLE
nr:ABC transporter permease [Methanoregulaceae archaeon]